jgi:hypothetical protein
MTSRTRNILLIVLAILALLALMPGITLILINAGAGG